MAKSLILVESQQKYQTLHSWCGDACDILNINGAVADGGTEFLQHLLFHNPPELSFFTEKKVNQLSQKVKEYPNVYIATSPDFIGDALALLLSQAIGLTKGTAKRISLPALSKKELRASLGEEKKLIAQRGELLEKVLQADNVFDSHFRELVNTKKAKRPVFGLAAAIALKMLCTYEEIDSNKVVTSRQVLNVIFKKQTEFIKARLVSVKNGEPLIDNKQFAKAIIFDLKEQKFTIDKIRDKTISTAPPPPLTTAKLISVAEKYLGFNAKQTLTVARSIYNGCDIGPANPVGLITYPISDSLYSSEKDVLAVREFIFVNYGKSYLPDKPRVYAKQVDATFSVIRPVLLSRTPKKMKKFLTNDQFKLYELIWNRFVASQMTESSFVRRQMTLSAGPQKRYTFRIEQSQTVDRGYLQLYPDAASKSSFLFSQDLEKNKKLVPHEFEIMTEQNTTNFYYTEGRLLEAIGEMDVSLTEIVEFIPDILHEWKFIRKVDDRLTPTQRGRTAHNLIQGRYPDIVNERFVRLFKKRLFKTIEQKNRHKDPVADFVKLFQYSTRPTMHEESSFTKVRKTRKKCPVCNGGMVEKENEAGAFLFCENYPETCQYSKSINVHVHRYYGRCDECNAELTVKIGRFGRFLACSTFPKCKFTKPYPTGAKCPKEGCEGDVIERTTKTGRLFYGCSFFPKCKFSTWQMPANIACPKCGNLYMVSKVGDDFDVYSCPKCKAEFDNHLNEM